MASKRKFKIMSFSSWRLWCCCHPAIPPPQPNHDATSLEEFDPRDRFSVSRAFAHPTNTSTGRANSAPPTARARTPPQQQRPSTLLLPTPPHLTRKPKRGSMGSSPKGKRPLFVRQDSEPGERWWQVGRRILERKGKGVEGRDRQHVQPTEGGADVEGV